MDRGNEPAHPMAPTYTPERGYIIAGHSGLTIRERFAMAAMQGILANEKDHDFGAAETAEFAVVYADALIAELAKDRKP